MSFDDISFGLDFMFLMDFHGLAFVTTHYTLVCYHGISILSWYCQKMCSVASIEPGPVARKPLVLRERAE